MGLIYGNTFLKENTDCLTVLENELIQFGSLTESLKCLGENGIIVSEASQNSIIEKIKNLINRFVEFIKFIRDKIKKSSKKMIEKINITAIEEILKKKSSEIFKVNNETNKIYKLDIKISDIIKHSEIRLKYKHTERDDGGTSSGYDLDEDIKTDVNSKTRERLKKIIEDPDSCGHIEQIVTAGRNISGLSGEKILHVYKESKNSILSLSNLVEKENDKFDISYYEKLITNVEKHWENNPKKISLAAYCIREDIEILKELEKYYLTIISACKKFSSYNSSIIIRIIRDTKSVNEDEYMVREEEPKSETED